MTEQTNISYFTNQFIDDINLKNLYEDANWSFYTQDMDKLKRAYKNSLLHISAWDNDKLVGIIRLVGDGESILYIQDIIVLKSYKRNKIGTTLLEKAINYYPNLRQKVLLTDDTDETRKFYEAYGFISCDNGDLVAFAKFN